MSATGYQINDQRPWQEQDIDLRRGRACELRRMPTDAEIDLECEYLNWRKAKGFDPTGSHEWTLYQWEVMADWHFGGGLL